MENTSHNNIENGDFKPWDMEVKQFCVFMHIAQFAGYIVPLAGFVLPFFMWFTYKDQSKIIDEHGKNIINWMISAIIYATIFGILCFFLIGFPLLLALGVCSVVFPILGAIKANENNCYKYPLSIQFLK